MKKILLTLFLFINFLASSQSTLKGKITDNTGNNIAYASLTLKDITDSTNKTIGTLSDENGNWQLTTIQFHEYNFKISMLVLKKKIQK